MAELKQTLAYEFTATDSATPAAEKAVASVEKVNEKVADTAKKSKAKANETGSAFAALTAALHGNFEQIGMELAKLAQKITGTELTFAKLAGLGLAVKAAVDGVKQLYENWKIANEEAAKAPLERIDRSLKDVAEQAKVYADAMARARAEAEAAAEAQRAQLDGIEAITKAENALALERELALANSDDERKRIKDRYASVAGANDRELTEARAKDNLSGAKDELARLEEELAEKEKDAESYKADFREAASLARKAARKAANRSGIATWWMGEDEAKAESERIANASGRRDAAGEALNATLSEVQALKTKIAEQKTAVKRAEDALEAARINGEAFDQAELNKDWAEVDRVAAEEAAAVEEEVRMDVEDAVKEKRLSDEKEIAAARAAETAKAEASAQSRLSAARAQVDRAWGWYLDRDSMAAQLEAEKKNAAAEKQFDKDFQKLKDRKGWDWREAKNLTVDEEAVRRVALAREEERAAVKQLEEAKRQTELLEQMLQAMSGEE